MKKSIFILLTLVFFTIGCNTSNDEYVNISKECISSMSRENTEELKNLFPIMDISNSEFSGLLRRLKGDFIKKGLKGWKTIEARGYILGGNKLDIIAVDAKGTYFVYHGLRFENNKDRIFFSIANDDLNKFESKEAIETDLKNRGGDSNNIHWF